MTQLEIIRAWKDDDYRGSLSDQTGPCCRRILPDSSNYQITSCLAPTEGALR